MPSTDSKLRTKNVKKMTGLYFLYINLAAKYAKFMFIIDFFYVSRKEIMTGNKSTGMSPKKMSLE